MKSSPVSARRYYACRIPGAKRYPNAADKPNIPEMLVDTLLAAAITVGFVTVLLFLLIAF